VGRVAEKLPGLVQDFQAWRGRRAAEPRLGRKEEVGRLQGLKKWEKEIGYQGSLGRKGNWAAGIEFKF
jgi:hypothetical protein